MTKRAWFPRTLYSRYVVKKYLPMDGFLCAQLKNVIACDPRVFLSILMLIAVALKRPLTLFPWPQSTCNGCTDFSSLHQMQADIGRTEDVESDPALPSSEGPTLYNFRCRRTTICNILSFGICSQWVAEHRFIKTGVTSSRDNDGGCDGGTGMGDSMIMSMLHPSKRLSSG